ncbi:JAB domain-containing protein [Luteolibacter ambystomatis]|uniref:JAB domain-containing protein n=1 Tax=Luteolibacter ambystomatis TaxID=2824561 RepID=A0A975G5B2_9BACT|nr:JAB domain-containing protein [Luteolibacter ambystomatis]QUE49263.1 JAB domain-containing protein [Luteolibacter ambystomatis]
MNEPSGLLGQFRVARVGEDAPASGRCLDHPHSVAAVWQDEIARASWFDPAKEHIVVFVLNIRMQLLGWNVVAIGTLDESPCHPREVLRPVIVAAGHGFVLAHNHPSGDPTPSRADELATRRLHEAAGLLQLRFHDHVILGHGTIYSFRGSGAL